MPHADESLLTGRRHPNSLKLIKEMPKSLLTSSYPKQIEKIGNHWTACLAHWETSDQDDIDNLQMQSQVVPDWEESNASFGLCVETKFCMYLRIQKERMLWIVEDSNIGRSLICLRSISSLALVYRPGGAYIMFRCHFGSWKSHGRWQCSTCWRFSRSWRCL